MLKTKIAALLAAGAILMGTGATATTAFADDNNSGKQPSTTEISNSQQTRNISFYGNDGRTKFNTTYKIFSPYDHTTPRKKTTKSAYYLHLNNCNIVYTTCWAALGNGTDVSDGHEYRVYAGDTVYLYNKAVERYGKGVKVRIDFRAFNNGTASGVWSPDR